MFHAICKVEGEGWTHNVETAQPCYYNARLDSDDHMKCLREKADSVLVLCKGFVQHHVPLGFSLFLTFGTIVFCPVFIYLFFSENLPICCQSEPHHTVCVPYDIK